MEVLPAPLSANGEGAVGLPMPMASTTGRQGVLSPTVRQQGLSVAICEAKRFGQRPNVDTDQESLSSGTSVFLHYVPVWESDIANGDPGLLLGPGWRAWSPVLGPRL